MKNFAVFLAGQLVLRMSKIPDCNVDIVTGMRIQITYNVTYSRYVVVLTDSVTTNLCYPSHQKMYIKPLLHCCMPARQLVW